jgi:uncharacterized protein YqjF (DUF2071 family)
MTDFLKANWEDIIMANYAIPPEILQDYLPKGVELDLFEGKAYVSLVGFMFKKTRIFGVKIPIFGDFEEVNLRFYVKRIVNGEVRRGVVFINETVPNKIVAWVANYLYKEHYIAIPTKHSIERLDTTQHIVYEWKNSDKWSKIAIKTDTEAQEMPQNSMQEFIFEHYFGYTKTSETATEEYEVKHNRWRTNEVLSHTIDCDFAAVYGAGFGILNNTQPKNVFYTVGSSVAVAWQRERF